MKLLLASFGTILAQTASATPPDGSWLAIGFGLGVLALAIFVIELFVPTGGMLGILCGLTVVASIISFFYHSQSAGVFAVASYILATPFVVVYGVKFWSGSRLGRRLILGGTETVSTKGLDEDEVAEEIARQQREETASTAALIGRTALTVTPLRPVGVIRLDGHRRDALSEAGIIDQGTEVRIVEIIDNQLKVRPVDQNSV